MVVEMFLKETILLLLFEEIILFKDPQQEL